MTATPRSTAAWFGPAERKLFGWLHLPAGGAARAGVVLPPPVGYEYFCAHRTLRVLAESLADVGIASLRFDYDGTGDSVGDHNDPARVAAWRASIDAAADHLRAAGCHSIAAVGMRLGATLTALNAADGAGFDALVLWDPAWSGRLLVRQMRAVHMLGVGTGRGAGSTPDDDNLEVAGAVYTASTVEDIRGLAVPALTGFAGPVLALTRPDQSPSSDERARLPAGTIWLEAVGQAQLLDRDSPHAIVPREAIGRITAWLDQTLPTDVVPCAAPPGADAAHIGDGVMEHARHFGEIGLFGIVCSGQTGDGRPAIVCLNNAADHHVGPNRLWVDWGRSMAKKGFPVVRVDIGGIGDSPTRPGHPDDLTYPPEAVDDIAAIVRELDPGTGVVLSGLCSGGWNAVRAGAALGVRGVCALNFGTFVSPKVLHTLGPGNPEPAQVSGDRRLPKFNTFVRRHGRRVLSRVPDSAWKTLHRAGMVRSRVAMIDELADQGVDSLIIWGDAEVGLLKINDTSRWALERARRRPRMRVIVVADLDHAMMRRGTRDETVGLMTAHIVEHFDAPPVETSTAAGRRAG